MTSMNSAHRSNFVSHLWLPMTSHGNSPALHFVLYKWSLLTVLTCGSKPTKLGSGKMASWLVFSLGLSLWGSHQFLDAEELKKVRFNERKVAYLPIPVILSLYLSYLWPDCTLKGTFLAVERMWKAKQLWLMESPWSRFPRIFGCRIFYLFFSLC